MINPSISPNLAVPNYQLSHQMEEERKNMRSIKLELIASIRRSRPTDENEVLCLCTSYEQLLQNPTLDKSEKVELFKEITDLLKRSPLDHPEINDKMVKYLLGFCEIGSDITPEVTVLIHVQAHKICRDPAQRKTIARNLAKTLEETGIMHSIKNYCTAACNTNEKEFKERLEKLAAAAERGLGKSCTILRENILEAMHRSISLGQHTSSYYDALEALFKKDEPIFFPEHLQNRLKELRTSFETRFNTLFPDSKIKDIDFTKVRTLQKEISQDFALFLQDITALPCLLFDHNKLPTEIHVAGSLAREEVYPFSDFEGMILFDDRVDPNRSEEQKTLLRTAVEYISLLVAGIGETMALPIEVRSLVECHKGFALDALFAKPPPILEKLNQNSQILLATPSQLQSLQKTGGADEETRLALYSLLKTKKMVITHQAELGYEEPIQSFLNETIQEETRRQQIALRMIQEIHIPHYRECFAFEGSQGWVDKPFDSYEMIDIKNHFIKTLFHALTTLSIYHGINKANILDIVDELENKKLFTPKSISLLKETVSSIYLIRLKMHLAFIDKPWKGSYDEARVPNKAKETSAFYNNAYALQEKDYSLLEKAYWLVLKPLFYYLQHIKKEANPFDLPDMAFSSILEDILQEKIIPFAQAPFIRCWVKYLVELYKPDQYHLDYYLKLSTSVKYEPLRKAYLEQLTQFSGYDALIQKLAIIRNRDGFQQARYLEEKHLLQDIQAMGRSPQMPQEKTSELQVEMVVPSQGAIQLSPELVKELFDPESGDLNPFSTQNPKEKEYQNCRHTVRSIPTYNLHIKELPDHPCMEYAAYSLTHRLFDHGPPPTQLVKVNITQDSKKISYPVLISRTIPGKVFDPEVDEVNPANLTELLISHILLLPGDATPRNFIFHTSGLTCIDNDVCFVDPVIMQKGLWNAYQVQFTSILFCLKKGFFLDQGTIDQFCDADPLIVLYGWLNELMDREKSYAGLFSGVQERRNFLEKNHEKAFTPFFILASGCIARLYEQMTLLQSHFKEQKQKQWTPFELLNHLIGRSDQAGLKTSEIGSYVKRAYEKTSRQPTAFERLRQTVGRDISQSMTSSRALQAQIGKIPSSEELEKRESYSPEQGIKELFALNFERCTELGMVVHEKGQSSFKSEFLKMVKNGTPDLDRQRLVLTSLLRRLLPEMLSKTMRSLNLSHCSVIDDQDLLSLVLSYPELEILDLRYCPKITSRGVQAIAEHSKKLKELYISGCSNITKLEADQGLLRSATPLIFEELTILHASRCPITRVQLKGNLLKELKIKGYSSITTLSLSSSNLEILYASHLEDFSSITALTSLKKIHLMSCHQMNNEVIDKIFNSNRLLKELALHNCPVTNIGVNPFLRTLRLSYIPIEKIEGDYHYLRILELKFCGRIKHINLNSPSLEQLFAVNCAALTDLHLNAEWIKKLNLQGSSNVRITKEFLFKQKSLELLNLNANKNLLQEEIEAIPSYLSHLQELSLNHCPNLEHSHLTFVAPFPALKGIHLENANIKSLSIQGDEINEINLNDNPQLALTHCQLSVKNLKSIYLLRGRYEKGDFLPELNCLPKDGIKVLSFRINPHTNIREIITKLPLLGKIQIHLNSEGFAFTENLKKAQNLSKKMVGGILEMTKALAKTFPNIQIRKLDLSWSEIDCNGAKILAEVLHLTQIAVLTLAYNRIGYGGILALVEVMSDSQIKELNLEGNYLEEAGITALAEMLLRTQVIKLNLKGNPIGKGGAIILAKALPQTQITRLNLEDNEIGDEGFIAITSALPFTQITQLNLATNEIGYADFNTLTQALPYTKITELNLSINQLGEKEARLLADVLPLTTISHLDLANNKMGDAGIKALTQVLPFTQITKLNLQGNKIGAVGASALAEALPKTQIEVLCLAFNEIGDNEAKRLIQALSDTQITKLNLSYNKIGDAATKVLAVVLPRSQISQLILHNNGIGDEGTIALAGTITNSQVVELNLSNNNIGDNGAQALARALPHTQIEKLILANNPIRKEGFNAIIEALPHSQITQFNNRTFPFT